MKKIFISYSTKDEHFVKWLTKMIADPHDVFLAPYVIKPGQDIEDIIKHHIENRDVFLLIYSQHTPSSSWVKKEIDLVKKYDKKSAKKIITVKIDNVRMPKDLKKYKYADLSNKAVLPRNFHELMKEIENEESPFKIAHTSKRITGGENAGSYHYSLFIDEPLSKLKKIRMVEYRLDGEYDEPVRMRANHKNNFSIKEWTDLPFMVFIVFHLNDGTERYAQYKLAF